MIFLVHVPFTYASIEGELGLADYSYYFVMQAYVPVLQTLGSVVEIADPLSEADEWYRKCAARGEYCVLLCFAPPHRVPLHLECPAAPGSKRGTRHILIRHACFRSTEAGLKG